MADVVGARPDVLITGFGTLAPKAAIAATGSIPIVFTAVGDPVGAGLVKSLREPGGNATGMSGLATDIAAKRLQLLNELVTGKKLVAVLGNPDTPYTALALEQVKTAAAMMGMPFKVFDARSASEVPTAIGQAIDAGAASLLVLEDPVLLGAIRQTTELVAKARLPAIFGPERIRGRRRVDRLWGGPKPVESQSRRLCRQDTQRRLAGQPSSRAADKIRARHPPECGKRIGAQHPANTARQCRRGDRVSAPAASWCDPAGESPAQVGSIRDAEARIFEARQFPRSSGCQEDAAIGIAAAALAFGLLQSKLIKADDRVVRILQGRAMGRLSEIQVRLGFADGRPLGCLIGGSVSPAQ